MQRNEPTRPQLLLLFILSLTPRLIGALWLPNAFGDAYAYTEQIYYLRRALLNGSFSVSHLFGFWLPFYQLVCASISVLAGSSFYVPKLVSAFCGGGLCVFVCLLTWELTLSRRLSLATAAVVALNPYHVFFSSSAMTDVPHAFLILLCAYCCIRDNWILACTFALAACLMRIESWTLIPLIPLAQFLKHSRRVTTAARVGPIPIPDSDAMEAPVSDCRLVRHPLLRSILLGLLLITGPVFWLYVSWKATGDVVKYFEIRNNYIVETLAANPWLAHFAPTRVAFDLLRLIYTANPLAVYAAVALLVVILRRNFPTSDVRTSLFTNTLAFIRNLLTGAEGLVITIFCSHLAFLLLAYFTRNQPEIWPRYGLIFFTLGVPLIASRWSSTVVADVARLPRSSFVLSLLFVVQFCIQLIDVTRMTVANDPNVIAAQFLEDQRQADHSTRIYCEDGAIRVLSGIPLEEFKDQYNSPVDDDEFLKSLKDNDVRFLVYKDLPGSHLKQMIARLRTRRHNDGVTLEAVTPSPRKKPRETIVVYRIHTSELANVSKRK